MAPSDQLTAIVVGSGWGRNAARIFASDPRTRLAAVVGRGSDRSRRLSEVMGAPLFVDLAEVIASVRPNIAAVAVHETKNAPLVRALLDAGVHVLCAHPVVPDAETVEALNTLAVERRVIAATDYSLRLAPPFTAAMEVIRSPLRIALACPGRALVVAINLAAAIAGPVDAVYSALRYPSAFDERRAGAPKAFPPTVLLEHTEGCVSTIVPMPHADPARAHRVSVSTERDRIDFDLPAGNVRRIVYTGAGRAESVTLLASDAGDGDPFADPIDRLVTRFIDAAVSGDTPPSPFAEEAHVRRIWSALNESARTRAPVEVRPGSGSTERQTANFATDAG